MVSALLAFGVALVVVLAATPVVARLALRLGAVDAPSERHVHRRWTPRMGGLALVIAFFAGVTTLFGLDTNVVRALGSTPSILLLGVAAGSLLIAALGVADDIRGVPASVKLGVQCVAALFAYACGLRIDALSLPFVGTVPLEWLALPLTVLWIIGIVNAMNLIDGLDGLATGIGFCVCVTNLAVSFMNDNVVVLVATAALAGALLGFLIYNFNPATVFLGDTGSMWLGYMLATTSMLGASAKSSTTVAILVPLLALGVPVVDTLFAMVRRFLERRPIFSADRGHIHHRLLDMGLTHRRVVLFLYALSALTAASALALWFARSWQVGALLFALMAAVFGMVRFMASMAPFSPASSREPALGNALDGAVARLVVALQQGTLDDAKDQLSHFAETCGLDGLAVETPLFHHAWQAEEPASETRAIAESIRVGKATGAVRFRWDATRGDVNRRERALFRVVAEACELRIEVEGAPRLKVVRDTSRPRRVASSRED